MHLPKKIEMVDTADLLPYVNNSRTHSPEQVEQIAISMREFGWTQPIIVDDENMVLAGHGRLMAAKKLKMEKCPVVRASNLSPAQKKAYVIADNKIAENSDWDKELLGAELAFLQEEEFDLSVLGFDATELADLMGLGEEADDESESVPQEFAIIINCEGEAEQAGLLDELESRGIKCRALV